MCLKLFAYYLGDTPAEASSDCQALYLLDILVCCECDFRYSHMSVIYLYFCRRRSNSFSGFVVISVWLANSSDGRAQVVPF
jgi:hypothetical protein